MRKIQVAKLTPEEKEFLKKINIILVTATTIEYCAVMGATDPTGSDGKYIKVITTDGAADFILAKYGPCNVAVIETGQGPDNTDKVLSSVQNDVKAKYVIAIGICYGANQSKTKLADIIVAKSIIDTTEKRNEGAETKIKQKEYHCGTNLFNLFQQDKVFKIEDKAVKVHVGVLVSEFTLQRSEKEKQKILNVVPQALGGEMEANGINRVAKKMVAEEDKFEWIVIKSIVDWGTEDKNSDWQPFGAVSCARFVLKCLEDDPLGSTAAGQDKSMFLIVTYTVITVITLI